MTQTDVVEALVALGFSRNEGRAYASLLALGPATGYEVGLGSGVPRSAVYAVLRKLVERGAARSLGGKPERFVAAPAQALLELLEARFVASGDALREAIERLEVTPVVPDAFSVKGYGRVLEEASRIASGARETLVLSGWPRELGLLARELEEVQRGGAYVVIFSHAALPEALCGVHYSYGLQERDLEAFWEHKLVLVADDQRTLIAATERRPADTAVLSESKAIAEFAVGQIAMDITLLAQRYGHDTAEVMARILGDRVGSLDGLLGRREAGSPGPRLGVLGGERGSGQARAAKAKGAKAGRKSKA